MRVIEQNSLFQMYANDFVNNIPSEKFKVIINLIMIEASRIMGNEFNDATLDTSIEMIKSNHGRLPLNYVSSAIYRGAMGEYGAGRLVARTINQWLRESASEYRRLVEHKEVQDRLADTGTPVDLNKYPMGSAINKKIDWLINGFIDSDHYDRIDIKELSLMLRNNKHISYEEYLMKL